MKKPRAIAISLTQHPLHAALRSAKNCFALAVDFMYGTPERARLTFWFAVALAALGCAMSVHDAHALAACAV